MDLMKLFDQAVREIKREVNLKVLKVSEIEQKVLDATDDEPWGPHGTALAEIAQATNKFSDLQMVMNVLWKRLTESGKNWRLVYKALAVIEYLVAHGSEHAVDDIIEHTYQISSLSSFEYVEPSGKDVGINVRKRAETISTLLNDPEKVLEVRNRATANRDKYVGQSSSGVTYESSRAASFSSSNFLSGDKYRALVDHEGDSSTFKWDVQYHEEKDEWTNKSTEEPLFYQSKEPESTVIGTLIRSREFGNSDLYASVPSQNVPSDKHDEDFDDFDPRGTSALKLSTESNQGDLLERNFVDLLDGPLSHRMHDSTSPNRNTSEVDLFADANFISATPEPKLGARDVPQMDVDLFASQHVPSLTPPMGFSAKSNPILHPDNKASNKSITESGTVDPFATIPLNNFDGSGPYGAFSSHTDPLSTLSNNSSPKSGSPGNSHVSPVENRIHRNMNAPSVETTKKTSRVSSAIWADSISRGLIDLNITTAPNKVNSTDGRIVGGLTEAPKEAQLRSLSFNTSGFMHDGSRMSTSGFLLSTTTSNDFFSSPSSQQYQFGGFKK